MKGELAEATRVDKLGVWTISNFLSISRILLIPVIYHFLKKGGSRNDWIALSFIILAAFTDILDGFIARRKGEESSLGKILDPLADKICIASMVIILVVLRGFPVWLVCVILFRDILVIVGGIILIGKKNIVLSSNKWGKLATHFMALLIVAYTIEWYWASPYVIAGGLFFLVVSTTSYGITMYHHLHIR
jgi:CDP-diacylglycerol--glycerol-3-phosphate 3-phosphatidyltransferase